MKGLLTALAVIVATASLTHADTTRTWDGTTGNWDQGAKWTGGSAPQEGDTAIINGGTVLLSSPSANLTALTMNGGTLMFTNWSTVLNATSVNVNSGATLKLAAAFSNSVMSNRVYIICSNLTLAAGAKIDAKGLGYAGGAIGNNGSGPGAGTTIVGGYYGGGGGHGGAGTNGYQGTGGGIYDSPNAPLAPGSGGAGNVAASGGGAVRIDAVGGVMIDGTIDADGNSSTTHGAPGAGGSIFISCRTFTGAATGVLTADGGNAYWFSATQFSGGAGGGRIAVAVGLTAAEIQNLIDDLPVANLIVYDHQGNFLGSVTTTNGTDLSSPGSIDKGHHGFPGTQRFLATRSASSFSLIVAGDPAGYDTPAPYGYGMNVNIAAGIRITNAVTASLDEGGGLRRSCQGWVVTNEAGVEVAGGPGNQAEFDMTTNLVLTYRWTNIYQLAVTSANAAQGSVNSGTVDGWYTNATLVPGINATAALGYSFNRWTGTGVPASHENDNPLTVSMTQARYLTANFASDAGETRTWTGTGNWIDAARWTPNGIPGPKDDAYLASGTATLGESMTAHALTVSNATTLVFTNWSTVLSASNVTVAGKVTLPPAFTDTTMSNRVQFVCTNFTLTSSGLIDVKALGFRGGANALENGYGPGAGQVISYYGGGGGHGGAGGAGDSGAGGGIYDLTNAPVQPGSGGGGNLGSAGGGAVRIAAGDTVTIDGTIDADAANATSHGGAGSGGAIFISCRELYGTASGSLHTRGGNGARVSTSHGGAGGGGRIAVAIGIASTNLQKLTDGQEVSNLVVTSTYAPYTGSIFASNGVSQFDGHNHDGVAGTYRFLQVASLSAYSVLIQGDPANYDTPVPRGYGLHVNIDGGTRITNTVTTPFDEGGGLGRSCLGWTVTNELGDLVAGDTDDRAVFDVTSNLVLTYHWTNLYWLAVTSPVPACGSVNASAVTGWYTNGVTAPLITATPVAGYVFNRWTGTGVPPGHETDNPLTVVMTAPRSLAANFASLTGEPRTWHGTGAWTDTDRWTPVGIPGPLDAAYIATGTVTVTAPTTVGSLVVSNGASMLFTNWDAAVTAAGHITIAGQISLPAPYHDGEMSNRVYFACETFTLASNGLINVEGRGYIGGRGVTTTDIGNGPGKGLLQPGGTYYGGGGGHGGVGNAGRAGIGGAIYDSTNAPMLPGSGGAGNTAGNGGGAVRIAATGRVTIDGTIDADGSPTQAHGGGGSGGSIFISCDSFGGAASGQLTANGGNALYWSATQYGGAGGGGRISVAIGAVGDNLDKLIAEQPPRNMQTVANYPSFSGTATVTNGSAIYAYAPFDDRGFPGDPGTLRYLILVPPYGGVMIMIW